MPMDKARANLRQKKKIEEEISMKCPRCGSEMYVDSHRKYDLHMCYDCGYIEGRSYDEGDSAMDHKLTNFERMRSMNQNEVIAFIAGGMNIDPRLVSTWLAESHS